MLTAAEAKKMTEISLGDRIIKVQAWIQNIGLENKIIQRAQDGFSNISIMTDKCPNKEALLLLLEDAGYKVYDINNDPFLMNCVSISWE